MNRDEAHAVNPLIDLSMIGTVEGCKNALEALAYLIDQSEGGNLKIYGLMMTIVGALDYEITSSERKTLTAVAV